MPGSRAAGSKPSGAARRGQASRRGDRLPRSGDGRVPGRRRGPQLVLVPRDEHAPPGRAPRHRAGARRGPRRDAARRDRRARPAGRARDRGPVVRRGPALRLPAAVRRADPLRDPSRGRDPRRLGDQSGSTVSTFYDAMLAKVVCHATTRGAAAGSSADTLARARIHGVVTNRDLLVQVLRSHEFLSGDVSTDFLSDGFVTGASAPSSTSGMAVAAAIALAERAGAARTVQQGVPVGWRTVPSRPQRTEFEDGTVVEWWQGREGYLIDGFTVVAASSWSVTLRGRRCPHGIRRHHHRRHRGRRRPDRPHQSEEEAPLHRPGRRVGQRQPPGPDARDGGHYRRREGRSGLGRSAGAWCSRP